MQTYRIHDSAASTESESRPFFKRTLKEAQDEAKKFPDDVRADVRIELGEIANDSKSVHDYLNGLFPANFKATRTWKLSNRGGLIELNPDGSVGSAALE